MQGAVYPSLKDRTVLVTGGGSGIGEAIVRQFINQGARVGFIDIDLTSSEQLLSDLGAQARVHFEHADLRDIGALRRAVAGIREALGPITILVNNAARDDRHAIEDVTPEFWDERIAVNLKHQFFSAQAVAPDMRQAGGGAIINIGSVSWVIGQGNMPCYTTAKSAVQGLTRALARDLGPHNVRVNSILPGWIMTQRQQDQGGGVGEDARKVRRRDKARETGGDQRQQRQDRKAQDDLARFQQAHAAFPCG